MTARIRIARTRTVRGIWCSLPALVSILATTVRVRALELPVTLTSDAPVSQPAASTSHWTAAVRSRNPAALYQFSVSPLGGSPAVLRSFSPSNSFEWTPMTQGFYIVIVDVRDRVGELGEAVSLATVASRLAQPDTPMVSGTANPLVVLYSAPACASGSMRVISRAKAGQAKQYSPYKKCEPGNALNFFVAGLLPDTTYVFEPEWTLPNRPPVIGAGSAFRTGTIPASSNLPVAAPIKAMDAASDASQPVLLTSYVATLPGQSATPVATDSKGRVIWYYGAVDRPLRYLMRPLAGGTMLVLLPDQTLLREIDLVGNTVRETNTGWISEQLRTRFGMPAITSFHHDAIQLPDGSIAAIASMEKVYANIQGSAGPVDILGDAIVVMDRDFNVTWAWSGFDKLDVRRAAVLGETCAADTPGCPPVLLADGVHPTTANDWLHSNSLQYLADGNFLLSLRHQDWVVKIDYRNGLGSGGVLWRLGKDGDFSIAPSGGSSDPHPWFSHQHNVTLEDGALWLFDNGNTRHYLDSAAKSRGQTMRIDQTGLTVSITLNADLGDYSPALGSAERLANGNYHFLAGDLSNGHSESMEIVPNPAPAGTGDFKIDSSNPAYRSFRMRNLATP